MACAGSYIASRDIQHLAAHVAMQRMASLLLPTLLALLCLATGAYCYYHSSNSSMAAVAAVAGVDPAGPFTVEGLGVMTGPYSLHGNPINPGNGPLPLPADSPLRGGSLHLTDQQEMVTLTSYVTVSGPHGVGHAFDTTVPAAYNTRMASWGYMTGCYESEGMLTVDTTVSANNPNALASVTPYMSFSQHSPSFITMMKDALETNGILYSSIFDRGFPDNTAQPGLYSRGQSKHVLDTRGTSAWDLLDHLCAMHRWPPGLAGPMGLLRKHAVARALLRVRNEPLPADKAQAVREVRMLNNNSNPAHMVHDAGAAPPPDYPADTPFNRLPWSFQQWSPANLVSEVEFRAQLAARFDCDGWCGLRAIRCDKHQGFCWRFQAHIAVTKAPCLAPWIMNRLGLGTAQASGLFVVSSTAHLGAFFERVVEPFSVRKGQRFAFMWLVCMQRKSQRHDMPFAPPAIAQSETGLSDWMDAAVGCGITVWPCSS